MNLKQTVQTGVSDNLYRAINDFKKGYELKTNMVKDEKSDLVAGCHSVLTTYRNRFPQLLNTRGVKLF